MSRMKVEALEFKFQYEMSEAKAVLETLLNNGVGVPDHTDIIGEMERQLIKFHEASGKLQSLRELILFDDDAQQDPHEDGEG